MQFKMHEWQLDGQRGVLFDSWNFLSVATELELPLPVSMSPSCQGRFCTQTRLFSQHMLKYFYQSPTWMMNIMNEALSYMPVLRKHLNSLLSNGFGFPWLSTQFYGKQAKKIELLSRWYRNCTREQNSKGNDDFHGICKKWTVRTPSPEQSLNHYLEHLQQFSSLLSTFKDTSPETSKEYGGKFSTD